jgi:hypothetical protein
MTARVGLNLADVAELLGTLATGEAQARRV